MTNLQDSMQTNQNFLRLRKHFWKDLENDQLTGI